MSLVSLTAPYVRLLTSIYAVICSFFRNVSTFPPRAPSLLAGYDTGLLYILNPCAFLYACRQWSGPVYRVSLGSWRLVAVSSGGAISSVLSTSSRLLNSDAMHQRMFNIVAGVETNSTYLHGIMIRELFPLFDKSLSLHSLEEATQSFGLVLLSQIMDFTRHRNKPVSLTQLNEPLFMATNFVLFGCAFSTDTYKNFRTLDKSIPYRFCGTLLWHWPSYIARKQLLTSLHGYLQHGAYDTPFSRGVTKVFKDNKMESREGAQLLLTLLWTLHSNVLRNAFFLLSFLLRDTDGFVRVREEIDVVVGLSGGLEALLRAGPDALDDASLQLLTSAIMETMRFTALHAGVCQASRDFDLQVNDLDGTTIPVKKGEYVLGDVHAAHMDATAFPDPETFMVDRFGQQEYQRKHLQTEGYPYFSFGGGKHLCKGRWLALYEIKTLMIILLHSFNFSPARDNATGWSLPRAHSRSVGVVHTEDDVFVRLSLREHGF